MIYNRSAHPVEIKKISIRLWCLRDEIEAAIERRIKECEAAGVPLYVDDIKKFYNMDLGAPLTDQSNVIPLRQKEDGINSLMESIADEKTEGETPADSETLKTAETIIAEQTEAGLENKKPNPILDRPYQRQAPDLAKISYGFSFLSDINMENVLTFTKEKFLQGQSVVVEFLIPQTFIMTANVTYCHNFAMRSRIISSTKPDFRLQCKFSYDVAGEREHLRQFLKSIEPAFMAEKKKAKKVEDDGPTV